MRTTSDTLTHQDQRCRLRQPIVTAAEHGPCSELDGRVPSLHQITTLIEPGSDPPPRALLFAFLHVNLQKRCLPVTTPVWWFLCSFLTPDGAGPACPVGRTSAGVTVMSTLVLILVPS